MKCLFKLALTLCLALSFSAQAFAADYSIPAVSGPEYAKPTSVEYVYTADGGAKANLNLSKDTALLPPAFGVGGAFPLNAISAPVIVNPGSSVVGGGPIVYPDAVTASTTQSATLFTDVTDELYYANGSLGTLRIPAIGLTVSIYEGTDSAMLAKGAGHFSETSIWNGNVALAAHNRGVNNHFGLIHTLNVGDTVTLSTKLGTRTYSVTSVAKVGETDREALAASAENRITLYTCVRDQRDLRWCVQAVEVS